MSTQASTALVEKKPSLVVKFAERYSVEANKLLDTLKHTAFRQQNEAEISNEQMMALLIVADQYSLNPFTKELYAYPDKNNGIVPVVSVDGWNRIVQQHPAFDGMEFRYSDEIIQPGDDRFRGLKYKAHEWIEVVFYRKDRSRPTVIREYFEEVYRPPFEKNGYVKEGPWQSHDKRMHRHKTFIQGARMAFGFAGLYDDDEAQRIIERDITSTGEVTETFTVKPKSAAADPNVIDATAVEKKQPAPPAPGVETDPQTVESVGADVTTTYSVNPQAAAPAASDVPGTAAPPRSAAGVAPPDAPEAAAPDSGVSNGEINFLARKAKALNVNLTELAAQHNVSMQSLTKEGFQSLKVALANIERGAS